MPEKSPSPHKKPGRYGAASLYLAVPTLLAASILIGFFAGQWADRKFGTEPWLMLLGLFLGFGAAARQLYITVRRVQKMDEDEDRE